MKKLWLVLPALAAVSCGPRESAPPAVLTVTGDRTSEYEWQEGDSWRFLAWALLDADRGEGHEALAIMSGHRPDAALRPGTKVRLPIDPSMRAELDSRLTAARHVRTATTLHEAGDDEASGRELMEAVEADPGWSIPRYDLALLMLERGRADSARELLEPVSSKPRAALLLGLIDWENDDVLAARRRLETAIATDAPQAEALAAAAIAYMVTGDSYLANRLWMRLLQDASAPSELRLMAVRFCLEGPGSRLP